MQAGTTAMGAASAWALMEDDAAWSREPDDGREEAAPDEEDDGAEREYWEALKWAADGSTSLGEAARRLRTLADELDQMAEQGYELTQPVSEGLIMALPTSDPVYHPTRPVRSGDDASGDDASGGDTSSEGEA